MTKLGEAPKFELHNVLLQRPWHNHPSHKEDLNGICYDAQSPNSQLDCGFKFIYQESSHLGHDCWSQDAKMLPLGVAMF